MSDEKKEGLCSTCKTAANCGYRSNDEGPELWSLIVAELDLLDDFAKESKWFSLRWILKNATNCNKLLDGDYRKPSAAGRGFKFAKPVGLPDEVFQNLSSQAGGDPKNFQDLVAVWRLNNA